MSCGVTLADVPSGSVDDVPAAVADLDGDVARTLRWAVRLGALAPKPGRGQTFELWELLASIAAVDVAVARIVEPHLDALAILDQVRPAPDLTAIGATEASTWGVYAAEGPGTAVTASPDGSVWRLDGVKPWCSLAQHLTHALVTADPGDGRRGLFAIDLTGAGVTPEAGPWVSRGLAQVVSAPVRLEHATAVAVGPPGWYLERPGFSWGGMGVAACWWGGAVGIARAMYAAARRREPDQLALAHLGMVDIALGSARAALHEASRLVDDPATDQARLPALTLRVRNTVADASERTILHAGHSLGPAPLALDERHARRVADLQIYLRQHHAERDAAALGRAILDADEPPAW